MITNCCSKITMRNCYNKSVQDIYFLYQKETLSCRNTRRSRHKRHRQNNKSCPQKPTKSFFYDIKNYKILIHRLLHFKGTLFA